MGRVLFTVIIPLALPTVVYILWRTFAPVRFGGSEAIHNNDWERMPWLKLSLVGVVLLALTLSYIAIAPGAGPPAPEPGAAATGSY